MWSRRSPSSRPRVAYGQEVALAEVSNRVELDERAGDLSRLDLRPIVAVPVLGERDLIAGGIDVRLAGPRPARRTGWTVRTWTPPGTGIARRSAGRWPRIPGSRGRRACHTRPRTVRRPTRRAWPWQQPTASHGRSGLRLWRICSRSPGRPGCRLPCPGHRRSSRRRTTHKIADRSCRPPAWPCPGCSSGLTPWLVPPSLSSCGPSSAQYNRLGEYDLPYPECAGLLRITAPN